MIQLRPDQQQIKADIYNAWSNGARGVLAVSPTGSGKTVVFTDIMSDINRAGMNQVAIAHRKELVSQMAMHVARRGIPHRIIAPTATVREIAAEQRMELGKSFVNPDARCAVAGVNTILARSDELRSWANNVQYVIGDEFHHYIKKNSYGKALELFPNARILGVTATPQRTDGAGLGSHADGFCDVMVQGLTVRQCIDMGGITDYEIVVPESDFSISDDAITASGDYSPIKMRDASRKSHIVGDVVEEYKRWLYGKRAICFATDVETAGEMANRFNEAGIPSIALSAKTPSNIRSEMVKRFAAGNIWVLVNVDLFSEGFDSPACAGVIMARPTASLGLYMQAAGRALRRDPNDPNKRGLIIDHVSNWKRHGLPDKPRRWTLNRRERTGKAAPDPEEIPLTNCKGCSRPYERFHAVCPYCGFEPPLPDPASRSIQQVDGDLRLLDKATLDRMRADMELEAPDAVAQRVAHVAGDFAGRGAANKAIEKHQAQKRLFDAISLWAGIQRAKGRSDSEGYRRFYLATGIDVLGALHKDQTRADYDKLSDIVEGWCNGA